jgi:hypothetical protein
VGSSAGSAEILILDKNGEAVLVAAQEVREEKKNNSVQGAGWNQKRGGIRESIGKASQHAFAGAGVITGAGSIRYQQDSGS